MNRFVHLALLLVFAVECSAVGAVEPPRVLDAGWQIELIQAEPELVTPTGCCFDDKGRLLVIECHTHFPPDDYSGPKIDRIYLFDDSDGDGTLDRKRLFHEGGTATMNITNAGDGWIALTTRSELVRIRDSDGDDVADQREVLLTHDTKATYPHNGLGGLTMGPDGWLYVGQGENFGEPYKLVGTDGTQQVGGGEGGNIFRCKTDGSQVERVATGFWNPFGIHFDAAERMWVVGNDPDSMPPNRLMHVVPGSDFGFQFRFGRAGIHPLQSWDGEFPGTLPMTAGTGEAACGVLVHGSHLWVTSWGDNRIERYTLTPQGASFRSKTEVLVQGGANFRPVGMATAPDGSVYLTDWVDRSYPVHGKGRLWRLSRTSGAETTADDSLSTLTFTEELAERLMTAAEGDVNELSDTLGNDDPFLQQAAMMGLIATDRLRSVDHTSLTSPRQQVALLTAWRWKELCDPQGQALPNRTELLKWGLASDSDDVLLAAMRWATERRCKEFMPTIQSLLERKTLSPRVFAGTIAALAYLQTGSASGKKRDPAMEKVLVDFIGNGGFSANLRALAVRRIPVESEVPSNDDLRKNATGQPDRMFRVEVVRLLAERVTRNNDEGAARQLGNIAASHHFDPQTRADAVAGLSGLPAQHSQLNDTLAIPDGSVLATEAQRIQQHTPPKVQRPDRTDLDAWTTLIGNGGDADAGRRVFFRRQCATCHRHSNRGANTGPDLTTLAGKMTRRRILESILQPSKEVGPLYVPWIIETVDGKVLTGLKLDRAGVGNSIRLQLADSKIVEVALKDIEVQQATSKSIMPTGLEETMTVEELRDLVAFLTQE